MISILKGVNAQRRKDTEQLEGKKWEKSRASGRRRRSIWTRHPVVARQIGERVCPDGWKHVQTLSAEEP